MIIDKVNLNHLRIFECVYRTKSMTAAAKELHLTQSGVSQHMKTLEDVIGVRLFDRVKQRLMPTAQATSLFKQASDSLYKIEQTLSEIRDGKEHVTGTVSIGMPIEFGNNLVIPQLAKLCGEHPELRLSLRVGLPSEMNEGILRGDLDFAFVDAFGLDKRIATDKVYDETLHLCCHPDYLKGKGGAHPKESKKYFEALEYVDYQVGEPVLRMWFEHQLGARNLSLNTRATVMDVQGIARLILSGAGVGVLPGHLVGTLEKEGKKLHKFKGSGKPVKNGISIAFLQERTLSPAAATVLKALLLAMKSVPGAAL